eukprot:GFKZ01003517.1.p1 GENE.GFKZ01003517.1~~GFKZ01003517.1.p1  ORF type:complete len:376 (+),score=27.31 GFKZ01003517.1:450-1577(+)
MARAASPQISHHCNPLMSRNPKQGPPYRHPRQDPHPNPFQDQNQSASPPLPSRSTAPLHQSTPIDPSSLSARVPDQIPSSFPPALLEVLSHSQQPASQPAPLPTHSNIPPYRQPPHPSLTISPTQRPSPLNIYHHNPDPPGPEVPVMWPPDQPRYEPQPLRTQPRQPRSILETPAPIPDFGQHQVPYDEPPRDRRDNPARYYSPPEPPVAPSTGYSAPGPSTDTRRGIDRVTRPCTQCGTMNHIRKKECINCKKPKEPPKKRVKRARKGKASVPPVATTTHHGPLIAPPRPADPHPASQQQILHARPEIPARVSDPREDVLHNMLDPHPLIMTMPPVLPATSAEERLPQSGGYQQRTTAFPAQTFEGGYRNFQQP